MHIPLTDSNVAGTNRHSEATKRLQSTRAATVLTARAMLLTVLIPLFLCACGTAAQKEGVDQPFADVHLHYNWDQAELVAPAQAIKTLQDHNVVLAVVFSTPTANALQLTSQDDLRVIHFFSPYISVRNRSYWFDDEQVLVEARAGLQNGHYQGIGELHVVSGMGPRRDNKVLQGLLKLAAEFKVPFNIHTEASSYAFLQPLCQQHPSVRFLWAHAGGILGPSHAEAIIRACPNVWLELSAKDPWHYGGLVDDNGKLRAEWRDVLLKYPDRFMTGTDPVWKAQERHRWDEADAGWLHYAEFIRFHRNWLAQLPAAVEQKIRLQNALEFFSEPH